MKKLILVLTIFMINSFILFGCTKSEDAKLMDEIRQEFEGEDQNSKNEMEDEKKVLANSKENSNMLNGISLEFQDAYLFDYEGKSFLAISILKDKNFEVTDLVHSYEENLYGYNNGSEKEIKIEPNNMDCSIVPYDKDKESLYLIPLDWDGYEEFKFEMQYKSTPTGSSHSVLDSVEFLIKSSDIEKTTFEEFNLLRFKEAVQSYDKNGSYEDIQVELLSLSSDKVTFKLKNTGDFPTDSFSLNIECFNEDLTNFHIQSSKNYIKPLNPNEERIIEFSLDQPFNNASVSINTDGPVLLVFEFDIINYVHIVYK